MATTAAIILISIPVAAAIRGYFHRVDDRHFDEYLVELRRFQQGQNLL